jgi:hypothetical protein
MKRLIRWTPALLIAGMTILLTSCGAMGRAWTTPAAPTSMPVLSGAATTNDSEAIAWMRMAKATNSLANPTPTEPLINLALASFISLSSAAAGYWARHAKTTDKTSSN